MQNYSRGVLYVDGQLRATPRLINKKNVAHHFEEKIVK